MTFEHFAWRRSNQVDPAATSGDGFMDALSSSIESDSIYWNVISGSSAVDYIMLAPVTGNLHQRIIIAKNFVGSPADAYFREPDVRGSGGASRIVIGITPYHLSGAFTTHASATPFGASTTWSRYWHFANAASSQKIGFFESEETFVPYALGPTPARQPFMAIAGNLLEHSGSKFYGLIVGGRPVVEADFWSSNDGTDPDEFMGFNDTDGLSHAAVFSGTIDGLSGSWTWMNRSFSEDVKAHNADMTDYQTGSNVQRGFPIHFYSGGIAANGGANPVGVLLGVTRGILRSSDAEGSALMSGSLTPLTGGVVNDHVYGMGGREDTTADTVYFYPASGSGLPQDLPAQGF